MKLFKIWNTPEDDILPQDSIILVDIRFGRPIIIIRTPWTCVREYYDGKTFFKKKGPCRYTWAWSRKPNGELIHVKLWIPVI